MEIYKRRTRLFVEALKAKTGLSYRKLASWITEKTGEDIGYGALVSWEKGKYDKNVKPEGLRAIASLRGTTIEQTEAWLQGEGDDEPFPKRVRVEESPVRQPKQVAMQWLRTAPLDEVEQVVKMAIGDRLSQIFAPVAMDGESMQLRRIIEEAIASEGVPQERGVEAIVELADLTEEQAAKFRTFMQGQGTLPRDLLEPVAIGLQNLTGNERYSVAYLRSANTPDTGGSSPTQLSLL